MKRRALRLVWRALRWLGALLLLSILVLLAQGWTAFGRSAEGARRLRIEQSRNFRDGTFVNPQPLHNDFWGMLTGMWHVSDHVNPASPPDSAKLDPRRLAEPAHSGLRITWFGHSSMLIEIDGKRVLTDPMWSERASPIPWIGPTRWYPPSIRLADLPKLDAVVISHDHYDHLDHASIVALNELGVTFVVPLGIGAHLEYWGVPLARIREHDWWEQTQLDDLTIVCLPARHASGRFLFDKDSTLWAGYAFVGPQHRVYYSGDTGLFPGMKEIGDKLGPFDVTLIETGQYHRSWPDWHIGPEQAVKAHQLLRGKVMLPVHWGLLGLAFHGWTEPVERSLAAAEQRQARLLTPRPGQAIEPSEVSHTPRWWPQVPWETAAQHVITSTQAE